MIQVVNDSGGLIRRGEICECKSTEYTVVKMVIESVRQREVHLSHQIHKLFLLHSEWYILDDNCSWYKLLVRIRRILFGA